MLSPDAEILTPAERVSIAERIGERYVSDCRTHQRTWERAQLPGSTPALRHKAGECRERMRKTYAEFTARLEYLHGIGLGDSALEIHRRALRLADEAMVAATRQAIAAEMAGVAS
jgi:hypothetical protein